MAGERLVQPEDLYKEGRETVEPGLMRYLTSKQMSLGNPRFVQRIGFAKQVIFQDPWTLHENVSE